MIHMAISLTLEFVDEDDFDLYTDFSGFDPNYHGLMEMAERLNYKVIRLGFANFKDSLAKSNTLSEENGIIALDRSLTIYLNDSTVVMKFIWVRYKWVGVYSFFRYYFVTNFLTGWRGAVKTYRFEHFPFFTQFADKFVRRR